MKFSFTITLITLLCCHINAQIFFTGTVYDKATNQPIPDVYVSFNGTTVNTITDNSGKFELSVTQRFNTQLVFSHISYHPIVIENPYDNLTDTIYMEERLNTLNEVTVRATRRQLRGDFLIVDENKIAPTDLLDVPAMMQRHPYNSLADLLQGQVAGLIITRSYGGEIFATIRGMSSFPTEWTINENEPLVVINGMPVGTVNQVNSYLNVNDIISVEVDKTGFGWGIHGANGVIIITTK